MGLLNDEETWKSTILEIINHTNDRTQLRGTYTSMLVFSNLEDQSGIWKETRDLFSNDFLYNSKGSDYNDEIYLDALDDIQERVWECGGGKISAYGLPTSRNREKVTNVIRREKAYNRERLSEEVAEKSPMLNEKQRIIYDTIMTYVNGRDNNQVGIAGSNGFFLAASGETGKSFVLNLILDTVRSQGRIALAVDSLGIAAPVLHGG
ncbi:hypothetical protein Pmani_020524 [Petrolisthes manimaculis]|uniref:ATP-dependent DNA helicase n=1 Tax=Petrolisthes manimaculis TaxID=1843537 RepID=A0AAE1PG17_9EUCA|nr:hypothetical protein Pmani_020524 [Petrolisthes manimaculis]